MVNGDVADTGAAKEILLRSVSTGMIHPNPDDREPADSSSESSNPSQPKDPSSSGRSSKRTRARSRLSRSKGTDSRNQIPDVTVGSKSNVGGQPGITPPSSGQRPRSVGDRNDHATEQPSPHDDQSGVTHPLSRYAPVGEVGRGGWGIIEKAIDRQLDREVAVKRFVDASDVTENERQRFFHEAKVTSQLQHPGIVPVHEMGDESGAYYVMKLLEGITLGECIERHHDELKKRGRLNRFQFGESLQPLLQRFIDVCHAVAYAHRRGVIHRDLKPANVMVSDFGETVVLDWGMAHSANPHPESKGELADSTKRDGERRELSDLNCSDPTSTLTEPDGTIAGTPAFMSPEQAAGKISEIKQASDIYSLGVILFTIIAGRHPYRGRPVDQILDRVRSAICPTLRSVQPLAPSPLVSVVRKAMAPEPSDRYETADQLVDDVRRYISGESLTVHQENLIERSVRWCRHHQGMAASIAISTSVLLVGAIIFGCVIHQSHLAEKKARIEAQRSHREAVQRLGEAREATDAWLIELSGSLEFYPGMESLRDELLHRAIDQYDQMTTDRAVAVNPEVGEADVQEYELLERASQRTAELAFLERTKAFLRLGDLHRITGNHQKASQFYREAYTRLSQRASGKSSQQLTPVSLHGSGVAREPSGSMDQQFELERIQSMIGLLLLPVTDDSPAPMPSIGQVTAAKTWLARLMPSVSEGQQGSSLSDFSARVASAFVRLELALHQRTTASHSAQQTMSEDPLHDAVRVARWLAHARGKVVDRRLSESVQMRRCRRLTQLGNHEMAAKAWSVLMEDLKTWHQKDPDRIDYLQSLAHVLLQRGNEWSALGRGEDAILDYQDSIESMETAWKLTDSDYFYRTNLATAQNNLGQLVSTGKHRDPALASDLLMQALRTYEAMLREEITEDRLRRYAQTQHALAMLEPKSGVHPEADGAIRAQHARKAMDALEILGDYGPLTEQDRRCLAEVKKLLDSAPAN